MLCFKHSYLGAVSSATKAAHIEPRTATQKSIVAIHIDRLCSLTGCILITAVMWAMRDIYADRTEFMHSWCVHTTWVLTGLQTPYRHCVWVMLASTRGTHPRVGPKRPWIIVTHVVGGAWARMASTGKIMLHAMHTNSVRFIVRGHPIAATIWSIIRKISFVNILKRSASIWNAPLRPIKVGPIRRCAKASNLRSVRTTNNVSSTTIKEDNNVFSLSKI